VNAPPAGAAPVLIFMREGRRFAVAARAVRTIAPAPAITRVPGAPQPILGLIGARGAVVALLELGERWTPEHPRAAAAVVVASDAGTFALAADEVAGFEAAPAAGDAAIEPDEVYRRARDAVQRVARR
jgi:purine-binding chemotaxis protein CheW